MQQQRVIPPFRYWRVEADVHRSAHPTLLNYRFLTRLGLSTIVSLTPEAPIIDLVRFCRDNDITLEHFTVGRCREEEPLTISHQQVAQILNMMITPERLPILVHGLDGLVITGVVMACLRKLQCWNFQALASEFCLACRTDEMAKHIEKFVLDFSDEVTIGPEVPPWLWGGQRGYSHPTIKIRHDPPLQLPKPSSRPAPHVLRDEIPRQFIHARADNLRQRRIHLLAVRASARAAAASQQLQGTGAEGGSSLSPEASAAAAPGGAARARGFTVDTIASSSSSTALNGGGGGGGGGGLDSAGAAESAFLGGGAAGLREALSRTIQALDLEGLEGISDGFHGSTAADVSADVALLMSNFAK